MGVLNRIVLIFILLAAAGATILSYFLFEKRTELLKGWDLMATQIDTTARSLDKGSGTNVAEQIKAKDFNHRNLGDMETKLKKLTEGSDELVKQRDALAEVLCNIGGEVGIKVDKNSLLNVKTYAVLAQKLQKDMKDYKDKNDAIAANFSAAGRRFDVVSSSDEIKKIDGDRGQTHSSNLNDKLQEFRDKINKLEADLASLAKIARASGNNSSSIKEAFEKQKADLDAAKKENKQKAAEILKLKREKDNVTNQRDRYIADNKKKAAEIAVLKRKINPTNNPDINRLEYQEKDAQHYLNLYALVRNQVKRVDKQWNFVTIDLGSKREVQQTFAGRTYKTILTITPGKTMTVVRGIGTKNPKVIGKIILREVHADYATADIKLDTLQDEILEGDAVIFLADDMKLLKNDIEKLLKKKK